MAFTAQDVKDLREKTGCGMMDCKKALTASDGDVEKAIEFLREKGLAAAAKKSGRVAAEGVVCTMVDYEKKVGVVIEVNSETDFVGKNADFISFVEACAKTVIDENPADEVAKEKEIVLAQIENDPKLAGKPAQVKEKMVDGRINKFYKEVCLLKQPFVKDGEIDVAEYIEKTGKELGGTIKVADFVRYEKGEGIEKREDDFAAEVASMVK